MKIDQFRIWHSLLIEQYQFIEMHLEGIHASFCDGGFIKGLQEVDKSNLRQLLAKIETIEKTEQHPIFSEDERSLLNHVIERRNYWVHNCYTEIVFDSKTDDLKNRKDIDELENDIREAEKLRERLFEIYSDFKVDSSKL